MKIRWPRLTFPPINLWNAPRQWAWEDTMTAVAEHDTVTQMLCLRNDELQAEKDALVAQVDRLEEGLANARGMGEALQRIGSTLDLDPGTDLTREAPAKVEALVAHVERLRAAALEVISFVPGGEVKARLRDAYDESPTTSLDRLKAEWQAEVLEEAADLYGHAWKDEFADVVVDIMRKGRGYIYPEGLTERAAELRRQAEGGDHDQ